MILAEFGSGQVLWSILWFFLFFIWIWLLITIFADLFRSDDLGGWGKALWALFIIVLPYLGVFVYLIARGGSMADRQMRQQAAAEQQFQQYVRSVASSGGGGGGGTAAELERLAQLRQQGVISEEEFERLKAKAMD